MLSSLKMKYEALRNDEFARSRLVENLQTGLVAAFWVGFFGFLFYYGATHPPKTDSVRSSVPSHGMQAKFY